jgi:hypothetical protein
MLFMIPIITIFYWGIGALAIVVLAALIHSYWNWFINSRENRHQSNLKPWYR